MIVEIVKNTIIVLIIYAMYKTVIFQNKEIAEIKKRRKNKIKEQLIDDNK